MNTIEKDDFLHALGQTLRFYNKELDSLQSSFWWTACKHFGVYQLKQALVEYTKRGKMAPKPADILEIIDERGSRWAERRDALPAPDPKPCPPDIQRAWAWYIGLVAEGGAMEGLFGKRELDMATEEIYLKTVNHEAARLKMPDAVLPEHRLPEYWT